MTKSPVYILVMGQDTQLTLVINEIVKPGVEAYVVTTADAEQVWQIVQSGIELHIVILDLDLIGEQTFLQIAWHAPRAFILGIGERDFPFAPDRINARRMVRLAKPIGRDQVAQVLLPILQTLQERRAAQIVREILQADHIVASLDHNAKPFHLLHEVLQTFIALAQVDGGALFRIVERVKLAEVARIKADDQELAPFIAQADALLQGQDAPTVLPAQQQGQSLLLPITKHGELIGMLILLTNQRHAPEILALACRQLMPLFSLCLTVDQLLSVHAESNKMHQALEQAHEELFQSTKLASIGELAAGIAHDINTPLTCIIGFIRLFLRFLNRADISVNELLAIRHYLEKACQEVEVCQDIVKNLLLFARKESKKYQQFSLVNVIKRSQLLLQEQFHQNKIMFSQTLPENLPMVVGNSNQIQQVLVNLMVNSKNAMPQGGQLKISATCEADKVLIHVQDTGTGIPKENFARLFEPFYTTNPSGKGTGLGLSMSKKIIEEHGGAIRVESEVGKGSTFTLVLPAIAAATIKS